MLRSEKVFHLTSLIYQKIDQLEKEKQMIRSSYQDVDNRNDCIKEERRIEYQSLVEHKRKLDEVYEEKLKMMDKLYAK